MTNTPTALTGANVRAEMARRGISQMSMAGALDMSQPALSKRLRGITPFDINELTDIAALLAMPLAALLPDAKAVA